MDEGGDLSGVGAPVEEAPIVGGRLRRRGTPGRVHRHEGGLVVEEVTGTVVLPYATTQVLTSEMPDDDDRRGRAEWTFARRGARWSSGRIARSTPLAALCRAAAAASTEIRLAIVRHRLAGGDTVDFGRVSATIHELWVHGHRPIPWAEAVAVEQRPLEPVQLVTRSRGTVTVADGGAQIADLGVLVRLIREGR